jgi:hypothetical protein
MDITWGSGSGTGANTVPEKTKSTDDIWEVRATIGNNTFRLLGFFDGPKLIVLTSGFAKKSNKVLNRKGKFWQPESYDRVIRDDRQLENKLRYTLYNPVKAGLISDWKQWPHTYCKPEFIDGM